MNRALGIGAAPAGAAHLLELPFAALVQNHVGTVHAAAHFALAEAASAECLQREFGAEFPAAFAVVRGAQVKYRRPATADLLAFGSIDAETSSAFRSEMNRRGRARALIRIDLKDRDGTLAFHAIFEWFVSSHAPVRE